MKRLAVEIQTATVGPLKPWMRRLAEWHATIGTPVKPKECTQVARRFAAFHVPRAVVNAVMAREDWLAYREEMALDEQGRLKRMVEDRLQVYLDSHYEALLESKKEKNWKTVAQIAEPMMDRVWPKRDEKGNTGATVIVNLPAGSVPSRMDQTEPLPIEIVSSQSTEGDTNGQP